MNNYLYVKEKDYELYKGKMQEVLSTFEENTIDSIITDPPYELNFMNKGWDNSGVAFQKETWEHCYKVLKPGGYLLAFGGSRTFHRIACAIEDAGFEIRDTIMWLYGSGFPKSMALDKSIEGKLTIGSANTNENGKKRLGKLEPTTELAKKYKGWGTQLKPAYEPVIVARKPFKGSLVDNVINNGVGALNIDECRVETTNADNYDLEKRPISKGKEHNNLIKFTKSDGWDVKRGVIESGRFPANVILTYDDTDFDEVCGGMPTSDRPNGTITKNYKINNQIYGDYGYCNTFNAYQDSGLASRYFYCAKASKKDRDEGLELFQEVNGGSYQFRQDGSLDGQIPTRKNIHPTVKPVELMQYLVRLVAPKGGTILDCFMGSGSTGKAVMFENRERNANYKFIGVEMTEEYLPICESRIDYALNKYEYEEQKDKEQRKQNGTPNIFDFLED